MITRDSLLNPRSAHDYVDNYFGYGEAVIVAIRQNYEVDCDALDVEFIHEGDRFTFTVWVETSADGSEYLYGEW